MLTSVNSSVGNVTTHAAVGETSSNNAAVGPSGRGSGGVTRGGAIRPYGTGATSSSDHPQYHHDQMSAKQHLT